MKVDAFLREIRTALKRHADKTRAAFLTGYMNTKYQLFGLTVPQQREVAKQGFSFLNRPQQEIDAIFDALWQSAKEYEVMSQCLLYYDHRRQRLGLAEWRFLKIWVKRVDNWGHSDQLSSLYALLHERYPTVVYKQYQRWNKSKHPWEVRASLVGLFYYAGSRDKQPSFTKALAMVKGAFDHPDVYVQKGVGWTLREMYNVYPEQTYAFLQTVAAQISSTAWYAATEKLSRSQKQALFKLRKAGKHL